MVSHAGTVYGKNGFLSRYLLHGIYAVQPFRYGTLEALVIVHINRSVDGECDETRERPIGRAGIGSLAANQISG